MTRLSGAYDLGRFSGTCATTGATLDPGAPCITALIEASGADQANAGTPFGLFLRRMDFSLEGWERFRRDEGGNARSDGILYYWRTTAPTSEGRRSLLVDDEVLLDIFHRLEADERPQRVAFRFVLGLFLIRRKLLRVVGQRREPWTGPGRPAVTTDRAAARSDADHVAGSREVWLVQVRGSDPSAAPIALVNPDLRDDDVREIAEQLGDVMQGAVE